MCPEARFTKPIEPRPETGDTGLGPSLVQQVISAHQGTLDFMSDGGGTTFTVGLPASIRM
jgi:nitrogen-specific signal transduction histidine kinase